VLVYINYYKYNAQNEKHYWYYLTVLPTSSFSPDFLFTSLYSKTLKLFTMPRVITYWFKHPIETDRTIRKLELYFKFALLGKRTEIRYSEQNAGKYFSKLVCPLFIINKMLHNEVGKTWNITTHRRRIGCVCVCVARFKPIIPMFNKCKTLQSLNRKTTLNWNRILNDISWEIFPCHSVEHFDSSLPRGSSLPRTAG